MKYKNYRNPYTNENRIYSFKDLYEMPFGNVIRNKQEILGQYRVLGVPTEGELQKSDNVVYVHSYTREDGTEVKAHYRSKREGGGSSTGEAANIEEKMTDTEENNSQTEIEKKLYPDEIAGVKRGKPMSFEQAGGKNVNPNYENGEIGYKLNCSACAAVHKAREMGCY